MPPDHERLHGPLYACDNESCGWTDRQDKAVLADSTYRCPRCHKPVRRVRKPGLLGGLEVTFNESPQQKRRRRR